MSCIQKISLGRVICLMTDALKFAKNDVCVRALLIQVAGVWDELESSTVRHQFAEMCGVKVTKNVDHVTFDYNGVTFSVYIAKEFVR